MGLMWTSVEPSHAVPGGWSARLSSIRFCTFQHTKACVCRRARLFPSPKEILPIFLPFFFSSDPIFGNATTPVRTTSLDTIPWSARYLTVPVAATLGVMYDTPKQCVLIYLI